MTLLHSRQLRIRRFAMLKRLCVFLLVAGLTLPAFATDYSDMWYLPAEGGWGVNFTQNENVIFMTFFLYGPDGKPIWYVAIAYQDANGNYSGSLYSTVGTYFGAPWNPASPAFGFSPNWLGCNRLPTRSAPPPGSGPV